MKTEIKYKDPPFPPSVRTGDESETDTADGGRQDPPVVGSRASGPTAAAAQFLST